MNKAIQIRRLIRCSLYFFSKRSNTFDVNIVLNKVDQDNLKGSLMSMVDSIANFIKYDKPNIQVPKPLLWFIPQAEMDTNPMIQGNNPGY